jgi:hypothetical protein
VELEQGSHQQQVLSLFGRVPEIPAETVHRRSIRVARRPAHGAHNLARQGIEPPVRGSQARALSCHLFAQHGRLRLNFCAAHGPMRPGGVPRELACASLPLILGTLGS